MLECLVCCVCVQRSKNHERSHLMTRLAAAKDDSTHAKHYVAAAKRNIALVAAARAWRHGVPWDEAYELCDKAIQKASAKLKLKPLPKRGARAKARL